MEFWAKKELANKKGMEEASKIHKPRLTEIKGNEVGKTVEKLLPMSPQEGPPLPRALSIRWPWRK